MAVSAQQVALESTLERIARIISERFGVTVRIEGARAYVDMKRSAIVLPSLGPDGLFLDEKILDGFLDHECAHVIHTDVSVCPELEGQPVVHEFWNNVEDVWIERAHGARYVGCHANMEHLNRELYASIEKRWESLEALPRLCYALERCYRGDHGLSDYASDPLMGAILETLGPEVARGRLCSHSREALAIARAVHAKVQALSTAKTEGVKDEFSACSSSGADGSGDASGRSGDGAQEAPQVALPSKPDGLGRAVSAESGPEGDGRGDEDPQFAGSAKHKAKRLKDAKEQAKGLLKDTKSGNFQKPLDVEGLVNEMLTQFMDWSTKRDPETYVVFTEAYDTEVTYGADKRIPLTEAYGQLKAKVNKYIGNLANILELTLLAEAESRWVGGARRGKHFDRRRLADWAEGSDDDRIYRYLEEGHKHDTAVTMLWDCSGSMGSSQSDRNKAALARIAAVACHEALKRCRIAHEVLGFNTGGGHSVEVEELAIAAEEAGDDLARYSRISELDARMVFVPFGCDDGRALVEINGGAANRDGECVLWAARRLARRPEKRKILIVGSDGHPQGARYHRTERSYLRAVVDRVINAGIELYALGIMDNAVKQYYPHWQVIRNMQDLPRAVMTQLAQSLPAHSLGGRDNARFASI